MIHFIKKILNDTIDNSVHAQFVKFSKGVFENKAVINISRNDAKIKISSTYELANELVLLAAILTNKLKVSGLLLSKEKIPEFNGKEKGSLFSYIIDQEIESKRLIEIMQQSYYALLNCSAPELELKIKQKLPRPSSKGIDKVNDKFCVMNLDIKFWSQVKDEFLSDLPEGKKYRMIHKYEIKEIILPKGEKDFDKIRILAKRKGILTRKADVDGKEIVKQKEFSA